MSASRVRFERERFEAGVRAGVEKAARATGLAAEAALKGDILNQPGAGAIYPRGKTATHRASAPGQSPAPDTGRLRNSSTSEVVTEGDAIVARAIVNGQQALALEEGTERIAPRPFRAKALRVMTQAMPGFLRRFLS